MSKYEVPTYLEFDLERTSEDLIKYIRLHVANSGVNGVVLGISGGVDSACAAALAVRALGVERIYSLILPDRESSAEDVRDSILVADVLGLKNVRYIDITGIVDAYLKSVGASYEEAPKIAKGNVKVRSRMVLLYYFANVYNLLVLGTSDLSEYLLGFFTKWGDGAADIYPLINLYKTQVRVLAEYLGIPEKISWKPSSPGLWVGHKAKDELGVDYDVIDKVLYHLVDLGLSPEVTSQRTGISLSIIDNIVRRIKSTEHKRGGIPLPPKPHLNINRS
ncbi:MAG: NAD+ synthase [Sulfolobales archaeon]|nr:NAD+ synthase [Sulfolobales archaeon]